MKLKYDFSIQEVAGSYMAVAVGPGSEDFNGLVKMNATGKQIFLLLQQGKSEEEIVEALKTTYNAEPGKIEAAVKDFILSLKKKGLLE